MVPDSGSVAVYYHQLSGSVAVSYHRMNGWQHDDYVE